MRTIIYKEEKSYIDQGVYFGKGVFETILWLDKPILLKEHLVRLSKALLKMNMKSLEEELIEYIKKLPIKNKAVKIIVTDLNIIISERDIPYKEEDYETGVSITLSNVIKNSTSRLTYIKSTCYYENILEKEAAINKGFNDVLFLNEKGNITETSCANIFIVKDNKIYTPTIEDGLLSGIIREWIISNFDIQEKTLTLSELRNCDEIFITNSLVGIMTVNKIDKYTYNKRNISDFIRSSYINAVTEKQEEF